MLRRSLEVSLLLLFFAATSPAVRAQELATDAERRYSELRNSQDVKRKLLADRWRNVTRQQEWSDTTGKFKTSAKYVEHDPQLAWVKLRVIQGTGSKRIVKDVQIPMEKLSKSCQARVRQIATLSEKMTASIEAEKKDKEEKKEDSPGEGRATMEEPRGGGDELDVRPPGRGPGRESRETRGEVPREGPPMETASEPPVTNSGPPLPAMPPKLPTPPSKSHDVPAPETAPAANASEVVPTAVDPGSWRTSYEAFRKNITPPSRALPTVSFGPMAELERAHETMMRCESDGDVGEEDLREIEASLQAIGEVRWEATVTGTPDPSGDWFGALGLSPPPEPVQIGFLREAERGASAWDNLKVGDRVRFAGRFASFDDEFTITLAIRLLEVLPPAETAPPTP